MSLANGTILQFVCVCVSFLTLILSIYSLLDGYLGVALDPGYCCKQCCNGLLGCSISVIMVFSVAFQSRIASHIWCVYFAF